MSTLKALPTWTAVLITALAGCTTYEKCGFEGCPGDAKITANVQTLLNQHPELGSTIAVQTSHRAVYLDGFVSNGLDRETAESLARTAFGVTRVVNDITVSHGGAFTETRLKYRESDKCPES
jgi:osmotically-inducible protein OsmY